MDSLNGLTTYGKTKVAGKQKNHISLREFDEKQKGDTGKEEIAEQQGYDLFSDNTFFAFIDVLGFTDSFMRSSIRGEDTGEASHKYGEVFQYYFKLIESVGFGREDQSGIDWYAGQTSDSLYFYTKDVEKLVAFIKLYTHFSLYAMSQNVFFRGGIANGALYYIDAKRYRYYGDCVINAYKMESEIAGNPAVYIDEKTYFALKGNSEMDEIIIPRDDDQARHFIRPSSGFKVDIKGMLKSEKDFEPAIIDKELIGKHIEEQRKSNEYNKRNYDKYIFLIEDMKEVINA